MAWLEYDAQGSAAELAKLLAIVHSSAAASPESVPEFVAQVPGSVEQLWLGLQEFLGAGIRRESRW